MRSRLTLSVALVVLSLAVILAGCSKSSSSPTEVKPPVTSTSAMSVATGNQGNGGGHGNGGHGGHGHHGGNQLSLQVRPNVWNTQYKVSQGSVQAFVMGPNLDQIDTTTIQMSGDGTGSPISPTSTRLAGNHLMATFSKQDAISLFPHAKAGDKHVVTLSFTDNGTATSLTANVRIVGPSSTAAGDASDE